MEFSQPINFYKETLSKWSCKFQAAQQETDFLENKLPQDIRVAQFLISVVAVILLLILFSDKMIIKAEYWPTTSLLWRGGVVLLCLIFIQRINSVKTIIQFQRLTLIFVLLLFLNLQAMVLTYYDDYVLHVFFDVIILIAIYFSTLFPFTHSWLLGGAYGILGFLMVYHTKEVSFHAVIMVGIAYFAANLVGIIISAQEHLLKRRLYYRNEHLKALALEMKSQAYRDSLTQIPNRRAFDDNYLRYQSIVQRLTGDINNVYVIVCDIDFFKRVNDSLGHDVGDLVLIEFSKFLLKSVRPTDGVYRFGGEEFVIVLSNCSSKEAAKRINTIIHHLNHSVLDVAEIDYPVTASFGLTAMLPNEDKKTVVARADLALYKAKNSGRNQLHIDESIL